MCKPVKHIKSCVHNNGLSTESNDIHQHFKKKTYELKSLHT